MCHLQKTFTVKQQEEEALVRIRLLDDTDHNIKSHFFFKTFFCFPKTQFFSFNNNFMKMLSRPPLSNPLRYIYDIWETFYRINYLLKKISAKLSVIVSCRSKYFVNLYLEMMI